MMIGKIARLEHTKKYGFINPGDEERDHFFFAGALVDLQFADLHLHQVVEFDPVANPTGPRAANVRPCK